VSGPDDRPRLRVRLAQAETLVQSLAHEDIVLNARFRIQVERLLTLRKT
jgi:hypothetical protein